MTRPDVSLCHLVTRLRFRQLVLLVVLGEHRNLHRAAAVAHIAQPSATKVVRDLERLFGFQLFERLPRGMQPTELGEEVITYARRALAELQRLIKDLERKRQGGGVQLIVGTISGAAADYMARAIAEIKQRRPNLSVKLMCESNEELLDLLLDHDIDLAIGRCGDPVQHNRVTYEILGSELLYVVARQGHPATRLPSLKLSSLKDWTWILQPLTSAVRQSIEQEFAEAGLETPANVVESTSCFATLQIVQQSDAIAALPESVVRGLLQAGLIVRLPLTVGRHLRGFGILSRRGDPLSVTAMEFIDMLRGYATSPDQQGSSREQTESQEQTKQKRRRTYRSKRSGGALDRNAESTVPSLA